MKASLATLLLLGVSSTLGAKHSTIAQLAQRKRAQIGASANACPAAANPFLN